MQSRAVTSRPGARKPSGRVTAGKKSASSGRPGPKPSALRVVSNEKWDVQQSRSVRSGWFWRGFLMLALLAVGVAIIMGSNHHGSLAVGWLVIAAGWFATSMWLWRQHNRYIRGDRGD